MIFEERVSLRVRSRLGRSLSVMALSAAAVFIASCDEEPTLTFPLPRTESNDITLAEANVEPTAPTDTEATGNATIALTPDAGIQRLVISGEFENLSSDPIEPDTLPAPRPGEANDLRVVNIFKADTEPFSESTGEFFATVELTDTPDPDAPRSATFEDTLILPDADTVSDMLAGQFYLSISTDDNPDGELRAQLTFNR